MNTCWKCGAATPDGVLDCGCVAAPTSTYTDSYAQAKRVVIDFNKVTSLADLLLILRELGLTVPEGSPVHERLRRFCAD